MPVLPRTCAAAAAGTEQLEGEHAGGRRDLQVDAEVTLTVDDSHIKVYIEIDQDGKLVDTGLKDAAEGDVVVLHPLADGFVKTPLSEVIHMRYG